MAQKEVTKRQIDSAIERLSTTINTSSVTKENVQKENKLQKKVELLTRELESLKLKQGISPRKVHLGYATGQGIYLVTITVNDQSTEL